MRTLNCFRNTRHLLLLFRRVCATFLTVEDATGRGLDEEMRCHPGTRVVAVKSPVVEAFLRNAKAVRKRSLIAPNVRTDKAEPCCVHLVHARLPCQQCRCVRCRKVLVLNPLKKVHSNQVLVTWRSMLIRILQLTVKRNCMHL